MRGFQSKHFGVIVVGIIMLWMAIPAWGDDLNDQLFRAAEKGDLPAVKRLLGQGADVNAKNDKGWASLIFAAKEGNVKLTQILLDKGADVNTRTRQNCTPLMFAVVSNRVDVVKVLLDRGADVHAKENEKGAQPLHYAANMGNPEIIELLIKHGAKVDAKEDRYNVTPLMSAAEKGQIEAAKTLLAHGADIDLEDDRDASALDFAIYNGQLDTIKFFLAERSNKNDRWVADSLKYVGDKRTTEVTKLLLLANLQRKAIPLTKRSIAANEFLAAVGRGDKEKVKFLIQKQAVSDSDTLKVALSIAEQEGHIELSEFLQKDVSRILQKKQNREKFNEDLGGAIRGGQYDKVKALIFKGADVNFQDKYGRTPLNEAVLCGNLDIIKALVESGADIKLMEKGGSSLLGCAACYQDKAFIQKILDRGASVNPQGSPHGFTPLMELAQNGNAEIVEFLIQKGANVNTASRYGDTALMVAAKNGRVEVVKILVKHGADINAQDKYGHTALSLAKSKFHDAVISVLIKAGAKQTAASEEEVPNPLFEPGISSEQVKELLKKGANINGVDGYGRTPLENALNYGNLELAISLIENGANIKNKPYLIFPINNERKAIEIMSMILDRGGDINGRGYDGRTPLMAAAEWGRLSVVRFLIKRGAKVNLMDNSRKTALLLAKDKGQEEVVEELKKAGAK